MKKISSFVIAILACFNLIGQPIQFIKYYGDICPDFGLSLDNTTDGGYILLGHTENFGAQYQDMYLIKIDSMGNTEWQKLFGGTNLDFGQSVQQTIDKGYILCGFTNSFGLGGDDIYLVKTDSLGNLQWQKTFGGTGNDYGYCVKQTKDKGFILCGSTNSFGSGNIDGILIKTDSLGIQQWAKYYGGANNDGCYSLDLTYDNGYVMAGYTYNFGAVQDDAMIIKNDSAGNQQWLEIYGGTANDRALCIKQCPDSGYCMAGYTNSFGNGGYDMYLVKTDSSGNQVYYKTYGGSLTDKAFSIDLAPDNGYILAGQTNSYGAGQDDLYVVKTDSLGNMDWQKYFGGAQNDEGFTIKTTKDNGYIAIGNTFSYNISWADVYVVKMDTAGFASNIFVYYDHSTDLEIFPNPARDNITIVVPEKSIIEILNTAGQLIKNISSNENQTTIDHVGWTPYVVDVSSLSHGVYIIKAKSEEGLAVKKFIKE